jgi:hypothetical protein
MNAVHATPTRLTALAGACLTLSAWILPSVGHAAQIQADIEISPKTVNLAFGGEVVTVHTNIPYNQVIGSSAVLYFGDQGVSISSWKSDNQGYFVAKFLRADVRTVEGLVIPGSNAFELWGATWNGDSFSGSDTVRVIYREPPRGPSHDQPEPPADR